MRRNRRTNPAQRRRMTRTSFFRKVKRSVKYRRFANRVRRSYRGR